MTLITLAASYLDASYDIRQPVPQNLLRLSIPVFRSLFFQPIALESKVETLGPLTPPALAHSTLQLCAYRWVFCCSRPWAGPL